MRLMPLDQGGSISLCPIEKQIYKQGDCVNRMTNRKKTATALLAAVTLLLVATWSVLLFPEDSHDNIRMDVAGESAQFVVPGGTAEYLIRVENVGTRDEDVALETYGTPEGWESDLSTDMLRLDAGENELVLEENPGLIGREEIVFPLDAQPHARDGGLFVQHVRQQQDVQVMQVVRQHGIRLGTEDVDVRQFSQV